MYAAKSQNVLAYQRWRTPRSMSCWNTSRRPTPKNTSSITPSRTKASGCCVSGLASSRKNQNSVKSSPHTRLSLSTSCVRWSDPLIGRGGMTCERCTALFSGGDAFVAASSQRTAPVFFRGREWSEPEKISGSSTGGLRRYPNHRTSSTPAANRPGRDQRHHEHPDSRTVSNSSHSGERKGRRSSSGGV